jgi:hypothetical protein
MRRLVIVLFVVILLVIGLFIANFVPVSRVTTQDVTMNTEQLTKSIVDQMFPGSKYTIDNGMINFSTPIAANYQTLVLEQIRFGRFVEDKNEYLAILRAPDNVTVHAGGFYYRIGAVFDAETNKRKSQNKDFTADEGEISILKGNRKDYVLFLGSTTYQGYISPTGGAFDASDGVWVQTWPESNDYWEHRYAVFGNDRLILYKKVIDPVEYETTIPPFHFEPEKELIWDSQTEMFR